MDDKEDDEQEYKEEDEEEEKEEKKGGVNELRGGGGSGGEPPWSLVQVLQGLFNKNIVAMAGSPDIHPHHNIMDFVIQNFHWIGLRPIQSSSCDVRLSVRLCVCLFQC